MSRPMEGLEIRDFAPGDQSMARRLIESGLGEHFGAVDSSQNPDLDDIWATHVAPGGRFYVAVHRGRLVGTLGVLDRGPAARVVRVSTHAGYRRRGVASALLSHGIAEARAAGYRRIVIHTQPEWVDSMSFYEHHGFKPFGRDDVDVHLALDLVPA